MAITEASEQIRSTSELAEQAGRYVEYSLNGGADWRPALVERGRAGETVLFDIKEPHLCPDGEVREGADVMRRISGDNFQEHGRDLRGLQVRSITRERLREVAHLPISYNGKISEYEGRITRGPWRE